jgi:hypothetical protein
MFVVKMRHNSATSVTARPTIKNDTILPYTFLSSGTNTKKKNAIASDGTDSITPVKKIN